MKSSKEVESGSSGSAPKEILSGREVQELLGLSRTTLWKLREEEALPYTKVGRKYLYLRSEIIAWLKDRRGGRTQQLLMPLGFPPGVNGK